ncbi:hypothetical protein J3Q64DRAFT_1833585 [Phycomyces blakesleeanus]|uniref:Uncharacterized protein n=2 Tax=Phycomyces blakesleeanus TaxID=4837 RepID=A0A167LMJ0_PHYB8|nr:hypothetical protein PHYBLDRAFT_147976 [Phycomyces blakesleeanus NRRL 1555(-)]OAD70746.1 hypothetical protein PHYBLDRAFT_147976 [Phycomyces blakesleeanus NRRL 1555(-)]|eukprot:XP_018288786.1 hypothetical protein PHYBLDRAFT_147976 [Phycomyces blakesleeanus NRRL 1555(-)]
MSTTAEPSLLSQGFSSQITTLLKGLKQQLKQLEHDQQTLSDGITEAVSAAISEEELADIKANMAKVAVYHTKILSLQSTMTMLTARSKQLQFKADKLKSTKEHYLSQVDEIRRMEQAKDQDIAAKVTSLSPSSSYSPLKTSVEMDDDDQSETMPEISKSMTMPVISKAKTLTKTKTKKKKLRVREVEIGEDASPAWVPKSAQRETTRP